VGNSAGSVRLLSFDLETRKLLDVAENFEHFRPVISATSIRVSTDNGNDILIIVTGDTCGSVCIWSINEEVDQVELRMLHKHRVLQSGVNCLSQIQFINEQFMVLAGGDDQSICAFQFRALSQSGSIVRFLFSFQTLNIYFSDR
jgi:hypothetical protein